MPKKTNMALFSHRSSIFRIPNKKDLNPENHVFIGGLMNKGMKAINKRRGHCHKKHQVIHNVFQIIKVLFQISKCLIPKNISRIPKNNKAPRDLLNTGLVKSSIV